VILCGQRPHENNKKRFLVTFCRLAKSYPLLGAEAFALEGQQEQSRWIPAFAGMTIKSWIPAFAGMTIKSWIPAFAGMTSRGMVL
jgi:hypothetical protein